MATTKWTTDHDLIRRWAEERRAKATAVVGTGDEADPGIIRLDFPGFTGEGKLHPISWDDWFRKFDESSLAFVYQDETAGGERSNFNKLVKRESVEGEESGRQTSQKSGARPHGRGAER